MHIYLYTYSDIHIHINICIYIYIYTHTHTHMIDVCLNPVRAAIEGSAHCPSPPTQPSMASYGSNTDSILLVPCAKVSYFVNCACSN